VLSWLSCSLGFRPCSSTSGSRVLNVAFACAVVLAFGWISALSVRLYRRARID
jgi:hypothetical protein